MYENRSQAQTDITDRKPFRRKVFDWKVGKRGKFKKTARVWSDEMENPFRENEADVGKINADLSRRC